MSVIIPNPDKLEQIKQAMKAEGAAKMHIISDFDKTLSKAFVDGKKVGTSYARLRSKDYLGQEYIEKAHQMFDKYYPIEIDPKLSREEKAVHMQHWWEEHHDFLVEKGLSSQMLEEVSESEEIKLREGIPEFLALAHKNNIPFVIMSAGIGNVIKLKFAHEGLLTSNVHIVSNFFVFDEEGKAVAREKEIIHTMNKHEKVLHDLPFYKDLEQRKNVILLGDNKEDEGMIEGFAYDKLIKVAFLNKDIEGQLERYKESYDIIITEDGPATAVLELLREILS